MKKCGSVEGQTLKRSIKCTTQDLGLLQLKGLSGADGSSTQGGIGAGVCGQCLGRRLSIFLGKYAAVYQAEIYAISACAHEIQMNVRSEKYVCICFDRWL
jgi:hypothetical protein